MNNIVIKYKLLVLSLIIFSCSSGDDPITEPQEEPLTVEFVLDGMQRAAAQAGSSQSKFIQFFNQFVIDPVIENPELLRKSGW